MTKTVRIMQTNYEGTPPRITEVLEGSMEDFNGFGLDRASYDAIDTLTTPGMSTSVTEGDVTAVFTRLVDGEATLQQWELADWATQPGGMPTPDEIANFAGLLVEITGLADEDASAEATLARIRQTLERDDLTVEDRIATIHQITEETRR